MIQLVKYGHWGFLVFPLAFTPAAFFTNTIPYWYLWWSNGPGKGNHKINRNDNIFIPKLNDDDIECLTECVTTYYQEVVED